MGALLIGKKRVDLKKQELEIITFFYVFLNLEACLRSFQRREWTGLGGCHLKDVAVFLSHLFLLKL